MHALALSLTLLAPPVAQSDGYQLPPDEVVQIVDAPSTPSIRISPDMQHMLLVERPSLPSIADVARPWVGLAGRRIDPANNGLQTIFSSSGILVRDLQGQDEKRIALPEGARINTPVWSHTSAHFAFTIAGDESIDLWVADVASGKAKALARGVNGIIGGGFDWMPDGEHLLVHLVPTQRGAAPEKPSTPSGPATMETSGEKSPVRTYQDLLKTPHDELLFEHYMSSQTALVNAVTGDVKAVGKPGLYLGASVSPDGEHLLVSRLQRPFSYLMPYWNFPRTVELWSVGGDLESVVAEIPMAENIPIGGVQTGPRSHRWHAIEPATVVWMEALDGGDPEAEVSHRDRWVAQSMGGEPRELLRTEHRATGLSFLEDGKHVIAGEYDRDRRWTRSTLYDLSSRDARPRVLDDRSSRDRYGDPGRPMTENSDSGQAVVRQDGEWIYRSGSGASPEGLRPFLDRQNLTTGESERLWRCATGSYERLLALSPDGSDPAGEMAFVTMHESPSSPPNAMLRKVGSEEAVGLTGFADPTPQLRGIRKELVTYEREDGVKLSATLYLPKDYEEGTRLPLVVWAYPIEYNDPATAGQVGGTPYRFTRIGGSSHLFFLTQGYAVMDGATMPIVGSAETMNDAFIEQIVSSAQAAIDKAVELGVADGSRVGVGGHSYGAFMTANLLAHCDLFDAGIARSGAYNRTLTPFGFQSERRTLWEAPDAYARISPFFHAHDIDEPLLMIHGAKDSNSGTYPIQSERMFHAIKGNGGKARLVMLPEESHGYRGRESVLHTLQEMLAWFDTYVKGAEGAVPVEAGAGKGH